MSKTQDKRLQRKEEQQAFIAARREQQFVMLEQAYEAGLKIYEDNKDRLSSEEIVKIEAMKEDQLKTLESLRLEAYPSAEA